MQEKIQQVRDALLQQINSGADPVSLLKSSDFSELYAALKSASEEDKPGLGKSINDLRQEIISKGLQQQSELADSEGQIDVTAPFDVNVAAEHKSSLLPTYLGTAHPLMTELNKVIDIFTRMGFLATESRQIDDDFNMFSALNFPKDHPARDGYDTFRTEEGLIPPAHTSTMQYRILKNGKEALEQGTPIASISYGRVFRNEDLDATHEHTFYQVEGVYVAQDASLSQMLAVLQSFFESYYVQDLKIKTQPGYFPFVEPGLEFLIEKPKSLGGSEGEWLEMLGCGMIHPNVLEIAGIDPKKYRGFAWGGGLDRLVMLAYGIDDVRYFESGKLSFLRKFV